VFAWILRHFGPGLGAIALAAVVLLLSDLPKAAKTEKTFKVAMLQMASQPIMDDGANGVIAGLEKAGFAQGGSLILSRFNAEGDMATANSMATELVSGHYDLVITLSTSCLQAVGNANRRGSVRHVFGLVSDPTVAGVGIEKEPLAHPAHMVGIGTLPPADKSFQIAREMNPKLKRVGVVWNPAEVNSEIATKVARETCKQLGIELIEANAENASAVKEAVASVVARDVDALWIGGDVTVLAAVDVVLQTARQAKIPVFTCMPGNAAKGAIFDVGANYAEVGLLVGAMASKVLNGEEIKKIPWETAIPPKLFINTTAVKDLRDPWTIPQSLLDQADSIIDESGERKRESAAPAQAKNSAANVRELCVVSYINSSDVEDAERGLKAGLKEAGFLEGEHYRLKSLNAQGDMAGLNGLVDSAIADQPDLLLTISTQALQAAVQRNKNIPTVFTMVANPFSAGVAKSNSEHQTNLTGAYGAPDAAAMMPIIRQLMPKARRLGTLFSPAEVNSVYNHELVVAAAKAAGYELESKGVSTPSEISDAAQAICDQGIDAICLTNSNLAGSAFPGIIQAARKAKLPVFAFLGSMSKQGATVVLCRDYYDMGRESGLMAGRVLKGDSVTRMDLKPITTNRLMLNPEAAKDCGLVIPLALLKTADLVVGK
jgi:ABC-type uncharacterized transport system substrate-binding protein